MAFFDPLKHQLRSVIQWDNQSDDLLFYQWSNNNDEIKNASKLIVGPAQGCIFVYEGKIQSIFDKEGVYNISTSNLPFITTIKKFMQFFESEHKAAFYFYKKSIVTNQKWGTVSPIKYIDPIYKFPVELVAFGNYSMQIQDPKKFFISIVGEQEAFGIEELKNIVNSRIIHPMSDYFASSKLSYNHIDEHREEIGNALVEKLSNIFEEIGFLLSDFRIEGTSFDEHTNNRINKIADTKATSYAAQEAGISYKDMRQLDALSDAAKNEVGASGVFLGANAGQALATNMVDSLQRNNSVEDRLRQLKTFFESQLITQEEYEKKKQAILEEL
jgi:membrane protease subunit (stomatin/prohibitin family)